MFEQNAKLSRVEGGSFSKSGCPQCRAHSLQTIARARMKGGPFSKCGSRLSAAHIRLQHCKNFTDSRRRLAP
eukprot:1835454-Pyramimonas_sp.AAC.1